jgi:hypothetical protein
MSAGNWPPGQPIQMEAHFATASRDTLGAWALDSDIVPTDRES